MYNFFFCSNMALSITNLFKTCQNGTRELKNVSLKIPTGMFGLLGPSHRANNKNRRFI